jgi:hypothetical protein
MAFNSALARPQQDRSMVGTQVQSCFLCRQPFDTGCGACCETFAGGLAGHARTPELRVWPNISTSCLLCPITFRGGTIPAGYSDTTSLERRSHAEPEEFQGLEGKSPAMGQSSGLSLARPIRPFVDVSVLILASTQMCLRIKSDPSPKSVVPRIVFLDELSIFFHNIFPSRLWPPLG